MAVSRDRVKFYLPRKYWSDDSWKSSKNRFPKEKMIPLLGRAFGMTGCECRDLMEHNWDGFYITCRPSQFARFLVYRNEANECVNGFVELRAKLVDENYEEEAPDLYSTIAKDIGLSKHVVERVIKSLCNVHESYAAPKVKGINVSKNPANGRGERR